MWRFGPVLATTAGLLALFAAGPRLTLAFERAGDPAPHRLAMTAEIAGQAAGLIISWSERSRLRP